MSRSFTIRPPFDAHLHVRQGDRLVDAVAHTVAGGWRGALLMPNTKPPITTTDRLFAYAEEVQRACNAASQPDFLAKFTLYLTDETNPDLIYAVRDQGTAIAAKLYPAHATTGSAHGVTDIRALAPVFGAMAEAGMVLCLHGEVTDPEVDIFDREAVFVERHMSWLRSEFPKLKIVFEHATTREAVDWVLADDSGFTAASITPQHLLFDRNDLLVGGIKPHRYCLPILKRQTHKNMLRGAVRFNDPRFFAGTDSAPHAQGDKESSCGCAGCFTAPHALAAYAQIFDQLGILDHLENFVSRFGPRFYGIEDDLQLLPEVALIEQEFTPPEEMPFGDSVVIPLFAGQSLSWQVDEPWATTCA